LTSRCSPLATSVTTMAAAAPRVRVEVLENASFTTSIQFFDVDPIVPPQESPTFQAVSSATPNSSVWLAAFDHVERFGTTAPRRSRRRHPEKLPWSSMTRLSRPPRRAPGSTTVASATRARPCASLRRL
jgi:hypothetical protein